MDSIIRVSGSPFEQGETQGRLLKEEIAANVAFVRRDIAAAKCDMPRYERFIEQNLSFLQTAHSDQVEEMRGIAQGSGLPFEDIVLLNIPAYFMTRYFTQECSMALARGKATADGCTYLIKNRDMRIPITQCVVERTLPDGSRLAEVNGVGTVTYPANGLNSHGLAIATTGFWSPKTTVVMEEIISSHIFVNIHFLLRDCRTVREVIQHLETYPRMNGLNIIAADRDEAVVIETTRDAMHLEWDDGSGLLCRTNHYTLPETAPLNADVTPATTSFARRERILSILQERYGRIRFQDLWRALSDHTDGALCVCRHPESELGGKTVSTSLSVLEDLEMFTSLTNPCQALRLAKL